MSYPQNQNRPGQGVRGGPPGGFKTPYVYNAMDDRKLSLTAPPIEGSRIPPSLQFTFPAGNPRGTIWTGRDNATGGKEKIQAKMDMLDFFKLLELTKKVVNTPAECGYRIELKEPAERVQNEDGSPGKKGPPVMQSAIVVGRNQKGKIFISVVSTNPDHPKIQFLFGQGYYSNISCKNEPMSDAEVSDLVATAWVNLYDKLMPAALFHTYKPREPMAGGGSSYGEKKQYPKKDDNPDITKADSGGGADWDDDVPFN